MDTKGYCPDTGKERSYNTHKEFPYTYIVECFVCGVEELAVKAVFPDGWKRVKATGHIMCGNCAIKLRERIERERVEAPVEDSPVVEI